MSPVEPILVADDDDQGRVLTERMLERIGLKNPVVAVANGDAAVAYLEAAEAGTEPLPALIVLDEHMPGRTGREILRWRRGRAELESIPTIMLTGDMIAADVDVVLTSVFLMKPISLLSLEAAVRDLGVL